MFKKKLKYPDPALQPPKAMMQLIDAFTDTYRPVSREENAEELFTVRRLRDYFQAWPVPKMPDPLPPYLIELERRGFAMQTGYDGYPALFCIRWKMSGEVCSATEVEEEKDSSPRNGLECMKDLIARRMAQRLSDDDEDEEEDDDED